MFKEFEKARIRLKVVLKDNIKYKRIQKELNCVPQYFPMYNIIEIYH